MKSQYVQTEWRIDDKGTVHMEFPIELLMYVKDADWVAYKNGIIKACEIKMQAKGN